MKAWSITALLVLCVRGWPQIRSPKLGFLGAKIAVEFNLTDGLLSPAIAAGGSLDRGGRSGNPDWIGLFRRGECDQDPNVHLRHKCYLDAQTVPAGKSSGIMFFDSGTRAGEFEARYFYGEDPSMPGAYEWASPGLVCSTYLDAHGNSVPRNQGLVHHQSVGKTGDSRPSGLLVSDCQCNETTVVSEIRVIAARFAMNCPRKDYGPGFFHPFEDQTMNVAAECNGKGSCHFLVNTSIIGDPRGEPGTQARADVGVGDTNNCPKDFDVEYTCGNYSRCPPSGLADGNFCFEHVQGEAEGKHAVLTCPQEAAKQECRAKRNACLNCFLDPVARTAPILITGQSQATIQDAAMASSISSVPGFEVYESITFSRHYNGN